MRPALGYLTISRQPPRRRKQGTSLWPWLLLVTTAAALGLAAVLPEVGGP